MNYATKKEFEALEKRVAILEGSDSVKKNIKKEISCREFIMSKKPKSEVDKAVCLIYFFEEVKGEFKEGVGASDLIVAFEEAREKVPKNPSDVLGKCANKCWIQRSGKEKRKNKWKLTNTGIEYVEKFNIEGS